MASRRDFIKSVAAIGIGSAVVKPQKLNAAPETILSDDRMGVLVDTTTCIGCGKCEWACKSSHGVNAGSFENYNPDFSKFRRPDFEANTVVNKYQDNNDQTFVKIQCMHCDHPACVSACIVGAFNKKQNGSVIWDGSKCIGCRYCMIACPFQAPAFEYHKAIEPRITKCDLCFDRTSEGKLPACVDVCPMETLIYGKRLKLIEIAREKIKLYPKRYKNYIYGEHEVGGTSWMYLSNRDFSNFQFPELSKNPAPGVSESIQHGIFSYFIPPIALYAILGSLMWLNKEKKDSKEEI